MVSGMAAGLYDAYIASMEEAKAHRHVCWHVIACRADRFFGRWEIVLGTGRSLGPFPDPTTAMQRAIEENNALIGTDQPTEKKT